MAYVKLDSIVRSAIANKGKNTLHNYVPYLHWAFKALSKLQTEGSYTDLKSTKISMDENYSVPFPEDMRMWTQIGVIQNGNVLVFKCNQNLSLEREDHSGSSNDSNVGLFSYDSDSLNSMRTTNVYTATENGVVLTQIGAENSFRVDWLNKRFQFSRKSSTDIYIEYVANVHDPSTETLVNDIAQEYIESFIYYRESRFKNGASHRETKGAEYEWLEAQDDYMAANSDLNKEGILYALTSSTKRTIDQ